MCACVCAYVRIGVSRNSGHRTGEPNLTNSKGNVMSLTGWGVRLVVAVAVV